MKKFNPKSFTKCKIKKEMKSILLLCFICMTNTLLYGQKAIKDSLKKTLDLHLQEDTTRVNLLLAFGPPPIFLDDKDYAQQKVREAIALATKLKWEKGEAIGWRKLCYLQDIDQKYDTAINSGLNALKISEEIKDSDLIAIANGRLGNAYLTWGNDSLAEFYLKTSLEVAKAIKSKQDILIASVSLCDLYSDKKEWNKVAEYSDQALKSAIEEHDYSVEANIFIDIGQEQEEEHKLKDAITSYRRALRLTKNLKNYHGIAYILTNLSYLFCSLKTEDSALYYANEALLLSKGHNMAQELLESYIALVNVTTTFHDYKDALAYHLIVDSLENKTYSLDAARNIERLTEKVQQDKKDAIAKAEQNKKDADEKRIRNLQYSAIGVFLLIAVFLFWNNRQKQKSKIKIQNAYAELKSTQSQLIQSEKMASLGELTAGIAHEIQNPLNFVNNFSEINQEMVNEVTEEINKGNIDEAKIILNDIKENSEKINHHGKRADAIVKGMLQHSRASSGQKELTDINALCDEYVRLSYHGLRAKDKTFNADFKTDFDETIGKIKIVPQDIGRVVLNLLTNAFYAVNEKKKTAAENYQPTVSVQTKKLKDKIQICVSDNGNGIPQNVIDKIFQPFFTTKPTGSGTGLGLSLSYDIITKAHSGTLTAETKENEGTTFIIELPKQL